MSLDMKYPAYSDLRRKARRRIPKFAFEYLDSGTGDEIAKAANYDDLDAIRLLPGALAGVQKVDLATRLMGHEYSRPFGIAPVGMSGLMWPGAEQLLASAAGRANIPYCLSMVATQTPEQVGPSAGGMGWFQLYPPAETGMRLDILKRAKDSGFNTLILTIDVAYPSRRERQKRAELNTPPRITPRMLFETSLRPEWAIRTALRGIPTLATLEKYVDVNKPRGHTEHAGYLIRTAPSWDYLARLRDEWDGNLVVKGVMQADDALRMRDMGVDAVWVSNHGARQFDATPSAIKALPAIRAAVGEKYPLIFDSGIRTGTDILRALSLGADFVFVGRVFHYGVAALGARGPDHVIHLLEDSMKCDMGQMAITRPAEVISRAFPR